MSGKKCELNPSRLYQEDITSEKEVHEWFIDYCEYFNWDVYSEVTPDSNQNIRCDVLIYKERFGWFGIEIKYCEHPQLGALHGGSRNAIDQVRDKYRGEVYHGETVNAWVVLPYYANIRDCKQEFYQQLSEVSDELGDEEDIEDRIDDEILLRRERLRSAEGVLKSWLSDIGMGWINIDDSYLSMSFGRGQERSVAIGEPDTDIDVLRTQWLRDVQETDIGLIREEIEENIPD